MTSLGPLPKFGRLEDLELLGMFTLRPQRETGGGGSATALEPVDGGATAVDCSGPLAALGPLSVMVLLALYWLCRDNLQRGVCLSFMTKEPMLDANTSYTSIRTDEHIQVLPCWLKWTNYRQLKIQEPEASTKPHQPTTQLRGFCSSSPRRRAPACPSTTSITKRTSSTGQATMLLHQSESSPAAAASDRPSEAVKSGGSPPRRQTAWAMSIGSRADCFASCLTLCYASLEFTPRESGRRKTKDCGRVK